MKQPPPSRPRPRPQRWAPPHRSEAGVFGPRGCLANPVYSEEPFPVFPLPQILVWPVPVSETLRRLPEPRQTPRGRERSSCQKAFTLHLFARCRCVASRMFRGPCGSQPADRCASGTVPQERRRGPPGSQGQRAGARPPPGVWPRAGSCQGSARASGTVPSSSRRHLRRQSPQVGELLLLRGSNPNPLYHQR